MNYEKRIECARNQYELDLLVPMLQILTGRELEHARILYAAKKKKFAEGYAAIAEDVMQGRYD